MGFGFEKFNSSEKPELSKKEVRPDGRIVDARDPNNKDEKENLPEEKTEATKNWEEKTPYVFDDKKKDDIQKEELSKTDFEDVKKKLFSKYPKHEEGIEKTYSSDEERERVENLNMNVKRMTSYIGSRELAGNVFSVINSEYPNESEDSVKTQVEFYLNRVIQVRKDLEATINFCKEELEEAKILSNQGIQMMMEKNIVDLENGIEKCDAYIERLKNKKSHPEWNDLHLVAKHLLLDIAAKVNEGKGIEISDDLKKCIEQENSHLVEEIADCEKKIIDFKALKDRKRDFKDFSDLIFDTVWSGMIGTVTAGSVLEALNYYVLNSAPGAGVGFAVGASAALKPIMSVLYSSVKNFFSLKKAEGRREELIDEFKENLQEK